MTTTTTAPARRSETLVFVREHGAAMLVFGGGLVWLLPVALPPIPSDETISWSAFAVACLAVNLTTRGRLVGWTFVVAAAGFGVLTLMTFTLVVQTVDALSSPEAIPASYREARGTSACLSDACGGHESGWRWAEVNGVTKPEDCGGKSMSFEDGCRAYAEESGDGE